MIGNFTAEDFAQATLATRDTDGVARRMSQGSDKPWRASWIPDYDWLSDEDMAADGWTPVVESRVTEHTLRDAQAPLSLESLAAAYEAAEQADECREGDVLMRKLDGGYSVYRAHNNAKALASTIRILSRAPREPWSDLADALRGTVWERLSGDVDGLAAAVHAAGWRKGGDES